MSAVPTETAARDLVCAHGRSLFERGLAPGTSGNISLRIADGWIMTPTGASLGTLDPARLAKLADDGRHAGGDAPTKESFLHQAVYRVRPGAGAVVHLHSTHAVAVSCLDGLDPANALPAITAYHVMRVGRLPLIPFFPPGDKALADAVAAEAGRHHAVLLANHGPVVAGTTLDAAVGAIEELEETAKLFLLLHAHRTRFLTPAQVAAVEARFPS